MVGHGVRAKQRVAKLPRKGGAQGPVEHQSARLYHEGVGPGLKLVNKQMAKVIAHKPKGNHRSKRYRSQQGNEPVASWLRVGKFEGWKVRRLGGQHRLCRERPIMSGRIAQGNKSVNEAGLKRSNLPTWYLPTLP